MADAVLEADRLRKVFRVRGQAGGEGEIVAVDDLSYTLAEGESLAIVGESGSGKTTLARMLVGLERPTSGRITMAGRDRSAPARTTSERRRRGRETQIVFQDPYSSLDPRQTAESSVYEVLRLHFRLSRAACAARVAELAAQVGLDDRPPCREPSPGASASASQSPGRSPPSHASFCWTRPSPRSTSRSRPRS